MIALALMLAAAQHEGHAMPGMAMPSAKPPSAAPDIPAKPVACTPEHAAMGHCQPTTAPSPQTEAAGTDLPAGNGPPPAAPPVNYADRIYGPAAMTSVRAGMYHEHGGMRFAQVMLNLAEVQVRDGRDGYRWDGEAWFGGDRDRLVIKSEGRGAFDRSVDDAEVQALYSRAIGPYFNLQGGVRYDLRPNPSRSHTTIGVEGLAPYWFEVEGAVFLSDRGEVLARAEAWYDQRITQRLILQPRGEVNLAAQDVPENGIGSGISDLELGLRLRYELAREFAPYVGVSWDRKLGDSARFARTAGDDASDVSLVAGVRFWF